MNTLWGCATLGSRAEVGADQLTALVERGEGRLGTNARAATVRSGRRRWKAARSGENTKTPVRPQPLPPNEPGRPATLSLNGR